MSLRFVSFSPDAEFFVGVGSHLGVELLIRISPSVGRKTMQLLYLSLVSVETELSK